MLRNQILTIRRCALSQQSLNRNGLNGDPLYGYLSKSIHKLVVGQKVTIMTQPDNAIALEIHNRPLEFIMGMGPEFIEFECK
jgi:hypothetical protein